jgi:hypothetical protein
VQLRHLRTAALIAYVIAFIWSGITNGIPTDRIAVLAWVLGGFVAGNLGRSRERQWLMLRDFSLFVAMWFAYDYSRGIADQLGMPIQVFAPRNVDRFFFFGTDPNVWMQSRFYEAASVRWYDVVGSMVYFTHFCVPMAAAVALWIRNRDQWVRYMRRLATVLFMGVATFIVFPAAPPWMAARDGHLSAMLARPTVRGWRHLGLDTVSNVIERGREVVNPVAAVPSLHVAFSLLVILFFAPQLPKYLKPLVVIFPVCMMVTLVYFGEHYIIDGVLGVAYVLIAFRFWNNYESPTKGSRRRMYRFSRQSAPRNKIS